MGNGVHKSEFKSIAAAFAKAKAEKEKEDAQALRGAAQDARASDKEWEVRFKATHGLIVAFFILILLFHILGLYLFTSGFLLTRLVLNNKSECPVPPIEPLGIFEPGSSDRGCWHPKSFQKAIIVIVDALRYDFTVPFKAQSAEDKPHHYHNSLPFLYETALQYPNNAFLLPFIADPPTTTLQRLKGLTTGTLPTFIDAGSNFAGTAIDEDNLVAQLRDASRRIVHLGDDTWHSLFPGYFDPNLTHAYDSFNVWDLHTVDNGVNEHLFPLLDKSNAGKWDVIFAHYLGVDHAGHRYGPDHPAMSAKLEQMDGVLKQVVDALDDETLLVIMGDHGMDSKGDHGGESYDEVQAALWMYSKKGIFGRTSSSYIEPPQSARERPVAQIDLVPTLSLLLGMPIPFNNLGAPIEEAFIGRAGNDYVNLAKVRRLTAAQIHRYQAEYALARKLDASSTALPLKLWETATEVWASVKKRGNPDKDLIKSAAIAYSKYQFETLSICRGLWARFDVSSMVCGIVVLTSALIMLGFYARGIDGDRVDVTPTFLVRGFSGMFVGATIGSVVGVSVSTLPLISTTIVATALGGNLGMISAFWSIRKRISSPTPTTLWGWVSTVFPLLLSIGFAANSFTIWEDEILLFFLSTFGALLAISSFRQKSLLDRSLGVYHSVLFIILTRIASLSRLCREEQMPYCKSTYYASANSSTSAGWQLLIPFGLALFLPGIIQTYYNRTKSLQGMAIPWLSFALRAFLLLSAVFWLLDAADDGDWLSIDNTVLKTIKISLSRIVLFATFGVGYIVYTRSPSFLNIETHTSPTANGTSTPSDPSQPVIASPARSRVSILGYSNVHGSRYFILITIWLVAVTMVQKPMGGGAIGILALQILALLEIIDHNKLTDTAVGPVVLGLLGSFHFFKTGHQATLASIQWESAFIPLRIIVYPWSPLLVVLNTFGAQILCAVAVPATVLWKQPPKKRGLLGNIAKAMATHVLFYATIALATTMWAGWLRRHLMLYRIFSPRFMVGAIVLAVVDVIAAFVAVGGVRWGFLSAAEVFGPEVGMSI
ncbi:hypothetical protein M501DRAFT_1010528 [Patellaria atrata CBS 101060]|uniref:GPI ethanolamine phosphate transferase 3 n=1 Tax=Patellaria atrata CBS 101060 TaxID=1346257 RepID=A0A9P4VUA7_9PEZI|nr:hypothetical protein M501DRAFT_1010528 [Patellaria atrata CBS 101060]